MARNREQVINDYKEYVDRIRKAGITDSQVRLMALSYLEALCDNTLLSYKDPSVLMLYAEKN